MNLVARWSIGAIALLFMKPSPSKVSKPASTSRLEPVQVVTQASSVDSESSTLKKGNGRLLFPRDFKAHLGVALLHKGMVEHVIVETVYVAYI